MALAGATGALGRGIGQTDDGPQQIELGGETSGWIGRSPSDIAGQTNPTLTLRAGTTYEVTWENVDGVPHNFAIENTDGNAVVESENVSEKGATQTIEFTASEEMAEYLCQVHPQTMRGDLSINTETATSTPTETTETGTEESTETGTEETTTQSAQPTFGSEIIEEQRGDVATFTVSLDGAEQAEVVLGSSAVNYVVSFTVVDGNADGEVSVALDTFVAGQGRNSGISAVADGDEIRNYEQETPTLSRPLDYTSYPLVVRIDGQATDQSVLVLHPRETAAARSGVAPRTASPSNRQAFIDAFSRRSEVATGDWAVIEFRASGLYATLNGKEAFTNESLGYELTIQQAEVVNAEPEVVPMKQVHVVVDAENDRFFAAVDSTPLRIEDTYEGTFAITDASPYVPENGREEISARFTVVERIATFDAEDDALSVPASQATLAGTTTVAPGTTVTVSVSGTAASPFQRTAQATVGDDGSWSVTVDFSDLEPGTTFTAQVLGLSDVVEGEVTSSG